MSKLSAVEAFIFIAQIIVLLGGAKIGGEIARKFKQPAVIGEIVAGILIGPTLFGALFPGVFDWLFLSAHSSALALDGLIMLSAIFLLFVVGLEIDIETIKKEKSAVAWVGGMGIVIPMIIGLAAGWFLYSFAHVEISRGVFALFVGAALSISALPVIARVLLDLNLLKTRIGNLIVAIATINDIVGWLLFTLALSLAGHAAHMNVWVTVALTIILALLSVTVFKKWLDAMLGFIRSKVQGNGSIMGVVVLLALAASLFTEYIGVHAVFGAFLIGVALAGAKNFPSEAKESIEHFTANILAPLFFVAVGLKVNFLLSFDLMTVLIVIALAYVSKFLAGYIGGKIAHLSSNDAMAIELGIAARGGMGIILAIIAFDAHMINEVIFEALVIMAVVTSMTAALVKRYIAVEKPIDTSVA